ncbi:MAG: long-chain fatty acid--CoA ligase [Acidobacteria bacterium]|nr:MAG: long-chain fatty acid--CoA ligase [Acidobacteriota bacterium]
MTTTLNQTEIPDLSDAFQSVAWHVRDWAQRTPDRVALRDKDFGIWQEMTSSELWEHVLTAAHGLLALGVEPGQVTSIHSEDRPEWLIFDFASVAVRAVCTGMYPTNPMAEVIYLLNNAGSIVHFAEDQEQIDKILDAPENSYPTIEKIIYVEPRGVREMTDPRLMFWDDFMEMGREHRASHPGAVEQRMAEVDPSEVMTLIYTSGTTGPPKGAMLTHRNVEYGVEKVLNSPGRFKGDVGEGVDDEKLTYLPLCHVAERIFSAWSLAYNGPVLNFAESIETVQVNLREVQPTIFFAVPRIWERIHAGVHIKLQDASFFKRLISGFSLKLAKYIGRQRVNNGGNFTFGSRIAYMIGYPLFFRSLKERIGMRHVRYASSGAAAIAPEVLEFFMGLGIPLYEVYGMTENTVVATTNFYGRVKLGTVGEPFEGIGFRIDEETGEIQMKHDGVFAGYWGSPEATADTFTEDGWLKTGDVGEWIDGTHVKIIDRIKHIIVTSGGMNISPSEIENSLKASPYIKEAMAIGDGRKYVTALIGIEYDVVGNWALRRQITYTTYRDLSEKPQVIELIQGVVNDSNEKFAHLEQVREFRMITKELDHEDGELTATQKLKRGAMDKLFGDLVESMYS